MASTPSKAKAFLQNVPLFMNLHEPSFIDEVAARLTAKTVQPGEQVVHAGAVGDSQEMYFVDWGKLEVRWKELSPSDGRRLPLLLSSTDAHAAWALTGAAGVQVRLTADGIAVAELGPGSFFGEVRCHQQLRNTAAAANRSQPPPRAVRRAC